MKARQSKLLLAVATAMVLASPCKAVTPEPLLHVPSPDWRDQIIYFVMLDRFDDGDPSNNDQGTGEYDPADHRKFNGGDLRGIERRLGYIRGLGASAVWITPPVANQWWNDRVGYGGYHGYWAEDFSSIDKHFGTLDDYQSLSHALHTAGMYLVQDIVTNHVADFIDYGDAWLADDPAHGFRRIVDARGRQAPSQFPFSMNDARDPAQREAGIYHWTPNIRDYADPVQEHDFQMSGLDDLNTENEVVREALRTSHGDWIRKAGVDAFRIDTVFYVPAEFFGDFLRAGDVDAPGILQVAKETGRSDFHVFGEGFGIDQPYADRQARRIESYMRSRDGEPLLPGMINFPLYGSLADVFARGAPSAVLAHRIGNLMEVHADPHRMASFVDNHDVDRFLAGGSEAGLRQALLAIMTLPGIPVIYYGTEQGFSLQRQAMFAGGYGSEGRDWFDTEAPLYRYIRRTTDLRRAYPVLSRGVPTVLASSQAGAGVLAWRMSGNGAHAIVAMNSADSPQLLDNLDTGLPAGTHLRSVFAIEGEGRDVQVGKDGRLTLPLGARQGEVWVSTEATPVRALEGRLHVEPLGHDVVLEDFELEGFSRDVALPRLVVDGDIEGAQPVVPGEDGRWRSVVSIADMVDADVVHRAVVWDETTHAVSEPVMFRVGREWKLLASSEDPEGDDHGRSGRYLPPEDPVWSSKRPLDILGMRVFGAGGALRVELRMRDVVASWNPPNGFDHVAPMVFVQLPDRDCSEGSTTMPLQNADLPGDMCWHLRLRAHGWSNALFSARGATAANEGAPVAPAAAIKVDRERNTIAFTFPAASLGSLPSLSGLKLYANTWDYDGRYRALVPQPAGFAFSGGDGAIDPLLMDETGVVEVP